jgi:hypothetical protein
MKILRITPTHLCNCQNAGKNTFRKVDRYEVSCDAVAAIVMLSSWLTVSSCDSSISRAARIEPFYDRSNIRWQYLDR